MKINDRQVIWIDDLSIASQLSPSNLDDERIERSSWLWEQVAVADGGRGEDALNCITATCVSNVKSTLNAKPKKRRRKGSASKSVSRPAATTDTLDAASKFVEQCGGLKAAQAAIEKIERIKSL